MRLLVVSVCINKLQQRWYRSTEACMTPWLNCVISICFVVPRLQLILYTLRCSVDVIKHVTIIAVVVVDRLY